MMNFLMRSFFRTWYRFDLPGLEVKYACEAATKVGAKIEFMGAELDSNTSKRLSHETRMTLVDYLSKRWMWRSSKYIKER